MKYRSCLFCSYWKKIITTISDSLKRMRKARSGYTLVEAVLYMGMFSIILLVLSQIFTSTLDIQLESEATSSVHQDGRYILSRLMYDIGRAQNILTPTSLGEEGNILQITIDSVDYTFTLDNGDLLLTNNNGTDKLNSFNTELSSLTFKRVGNLGGKHTIKVTFTLASKTVEEIIDFQTTIGLR